MPRLISVREVKFVVPNDEWRGKPRYKDPRGYEVEIVEEPILIDHYKAEIAQNLLRARDQVKICAELGNHNFHPSGAPPMGRVDGARSLPWCELWLQRTEAEHYTEQRHLLVRIKIPIGPGGTV